MADKIKPTILCVDDEQDILDSLFDTLMDSYNVKTATSGADALKIIQEHEIAVVISDQRMPGMTGSQLLHEVNIIKPRCKKVLLTGYSDIDAAVEAINKGAVNKYVHKPWDEQELVEAVGHLIKLYNADEFMNKMIEDSKQIKAKVENWKHHSDLLSQFMDGCQMGMCVVDEEGHIISVNKTGLRLLKFENMDAVKDNNLDTFFVLDAAKRQMFLELYENGQSYRPLEVKQADGGVSNVAASLVFLNDEKGVKQLKGVLFN
ncbi:MAG: response regulator [Candidatus Magnetominusculus sp. LBB02]|nr:response regulator [Candidatus Magnetominusculus sp. LBB02]